MRIPSLLAAVFLLATAPAALAGRLSSGFEARSRDLEGSEEVKALIVMKEQAPVASLDAELRARGATRAERHARIVDALRETADRSQTAIRRDIAAARGRNAIRGSASYWLVNAITVVGTIDGIRELAQRPDVEIVEPDLLTERIVPVPPGRALPPIPRSIGVAPGILAIEADRVWHELDIDGTGALVGNLDTGVDGLHPALAARWRGNFAPVAECWRDGAGFGDTSPIDRDVHGTHVMGTICGVAADDSIGVAPGALWIADNSILQAAGVEFDNDVLSALQWFSDPDGNSLTIEDVPDVVENSWSVSEAVEGYFDCDSRWWTAIDNCEAAGVALVWSAGNDGPDPGTIRSPADRAQSPLSSFSVGATIDASPFTIWSGSSRGPSGCGGAFATKPEICAPGVDVYSAEPGGGYQLLSGTSMAGPHVAGVVALMRAANPDIDVPAIKQILIDTATDLGAPGDEDTYGHGFVNAFDAVTAALNGFGEVEGVVTDSTTALPIPGVLVDVVDDPRQATTNELGQFHLALPESTWTLEYSAFGYVTQQQVIDVTAFDTTDGSLALVPITTATISGTVTQFPSAPAGNASITILDVPISPAISNPDGTYSIQVPDSTTYVVRARKNGFASHLATIPVNGNTLFDFVLGKLTDENFESGDFLDWPWSFAGNAPWTIDAVNPQEGSFSARSGDIGANQSSTMTIQLSLQNPDSVRFHTRIDSEPSGDRLRFSIDGVLKGEWSGSSPWTQRAFAVANGTHTFEWSYTKNASVDVGADAAWVDRIDFPAIGPALNPEISVQPSSMSHSLQSDEMVQDSFTLINSGAGALTWNASLVDPGVPGTRGRGGPDIFGYRWIDSDDVAGPEYEWIEISGVGTQMVMGDNTFAGPFQLGFTFPYYVGSFHEVYVSSNGFVTFSSNTGAFATNAPMPSPTPPNRIIAPYWDDLNPSEGGFIYRYADLQNGRFIVEWNGVVQQAPGGAGNPQTFQVILNSDGSIVYQYKTVSEATGCSVGIENAIGNVGLQVAFNSPYLHDEHAILISTEPWLDWIQLGVTSGVVASQSLDDVIVTFDATDLEDGVYEAIIRLATNDLDEPVVDLPVTLTVAQVTGVLPGTGPVTYQLGPARPNPFTSRANISYAVPVDGRHVEIRIFDVSGRLVKTLVNESSLPGTHSVQWDGRDDRGTSVAPGVYFYRMNADSFSQIRKMTLLK